jgi:hypothetical protein
MSMSELQIGAGDAIQDADLGASKPAPQVQYKQRPTQHPTVISCGHKLDTRQLPANSHCEDCWDAFFEANAQGLASVHLLLLTDGTRAVTAIHGAKFTKALGKYLRKQLLKMHQQTQSETSIEAPSLMEKV